MTPVWKYKRVTVSPGKHGEGDFRVALGGVAPTHGELLAVIHWILKAEERYNRPGQMGRVLLWRLIENVCTQWCPLDDSIVDADGAAAREDIKEATLA